MPVRKTILILDDDPSVCETLKIALSTLFNVDFFTEPPQLLNRLQKGNPDLLILDYKIKDIDGIAFYKKELAKLNIPTILISGFIGQNISEEQYSALSKFFIKILEKPFEIFELIQFIEDKLDI